MRLVFSVYLTGTIALYKMIPCSEYCILQLVSGEKGSHWYMPNFNLNHACLKLNQAVVVPKPSHSSLIMVDEETVL